MFLQGNAHDFKFTERKNQALKCPNRLPATQILNIVKGKTQMIDDGKSVYNGIELNRILHGKVQQNRKEQSKMDVCQYIILESKVHVNGCRRE